jgi:hypothetical protein
LRRWPPLRPGCRLDDRTLAIFDTQIGFPNRVARTASYGRFDADALDAGERVHHELFHPPELSRGLAQEVTK